MNTKLKLALLPASLLAVLFARPSETRPVEPATQPVAVSVASTGGAASEGEESASPLFFDPANTALVVTDPQNDFLSPEGVAWGVVGASVTENHTVENIDALFKAAKGGGYPVFVSPHYYFPHDKHWQFEGTLEKLMHDIKMFDRADALSLEDFEGPRFQRIAHVKYLVETGKLDTSLRWVDETKTESAA